ncbi:MAG: type II CAAX endopeptidase family protein [Vicinamibacterales bacterium]
MTPATTPMVLSAARQDLTALAMVLLWTLGAWASHVYGIWGALGVSAAVLSAMVLALEGRAVVGNGPHARLWPLGVGAGVVMALGTTALFGPVTTAFPALFGDVSRLYEAFGDRGSVATLLLLPVVVTGEEIVWRGAVQGALARRMRWLPAAVAGALVYALAHTPVGSPALVLTCLGAGFCWSALRGLTDSLPTTIVAHLVWDFAVLVVHQLAPTA